ncbi:MAG: sugar ABC transporter substrate-binding protein, partial [Spirochaetales bacterium]|nr:sugar ABC transporter substrate-binding protein [Spirochaetales bacterium]
MRRIITAVAVLALLTVSPLFSSGSDEDSARDAGITFWTMSLSPAFDDYINGVIADFESVNPGVTVEWVDVPWGDMETRVLTAAASGTLPDVANLNLPFSQRLAENGVLVNMDEAASAARDDYFDGTWLASSYNGEVFALPWYITTNMIYYNAELFEAAGLSPDAPPSDFDELREYARAVREATGAYGYMTFFNDQFIMEELERMGIRLFNEDFTRARFNEAAVYEAVEYYRSMLEEGLIPRETLISRSGTGEAIQLYSAGELAMFFGGTSHARMIRENSQEVYAATRVAPQIIGSGGKRNIAVMNIAVPESSPHVEAAVDFAMFITNNENQVAFARAAGAIVPSTRGALDDPFFSESDGTAATDARIMSAREVAEGTVIFPPIQNWPEVRDAFINAFQRSVAGDGAVE